MAAKKQDKESESYLNSKQIHSQIKTNKKYIRKLFTTKINLIKKLVDYQISLTDMYLRQILVKEHLRLRYNENIVVNNTLINQINLSHSIIILIENTFYGSARVLLRQFFEFLIIGKFSEFDNNIVQKWESKTEGVRDFDINLSLDIFNKLKMKKDISLLQKTWRMLSDLSHPTKYSQQMPPLSDIDDNLAWIKESYPDIHHTLDLFFMLLCMNYHLLISNWGRKGKGWDSGYYKDSVGVWKKEKIIKEKIRIIIKGYFEINKKHKGINTELKKTILQYKQNWQK